MKKPSSNWVQIPYDPALKEKARELRNNPTPAEKQFWYALQKMPEARRLRFNRQKPLGEFIVDFYCCERGLIIEIDGDTQAGAEAERQDGDRTKFLESQGLRVVRFTNKEVLQNIEGVMKILSRQLDIEPFKSP